MSDFLDSVPKFDPRQVFVDTVTRMNQLAEALEAKTFKGLLNVKVTVEPTSYHGVHDYTLTLRSKTLEERLLTVSIVKGEYPVKVRSKHFYGKRDALNDAELVEALKCAILDPTLIQRIEALLPLLRAYG